MVYTGSGNVPYVQFKSLSDFISEPKCSKFAVGLQTRRGKTWNARGPVGLLTEGPRETGARTCTKYLRVCSVGIVRIIRESILRWPNRPSPF